MSDITQSEEALVIRTNFTDDSTWENIKLLIAKPSLEHGFEAYVSFVDDAQYDGLSLDQLLQLFPEDSHHTFVFLVDSLTLGHSDLPILCIDLNTERGRSFRVIPSEMWAVENNLSIANMDFADFADHTDDENLFKGFPE